MSPEQSDIQALESTIMEEAREEASQILADAQAQAESIQQQAQAQADAEREVILQRAREEAKALREHAAAAAQLEAQTLKLKRREQLLERTFADARRELASVPQWLDYEQIAHRLVYEALENLGADEVLVRADEGTRRVLGDEVLADLGRGLGVHMRIGEPLTQSTGVVLETPDGHRRYDNTLETRLARMRDALRTPVYRVLMGETP
jgi:vacuolar-type H+-ATPase subunit E/Vma4